MASTLFGLVQVTLLKECDFMDPNSIDKAIQEGVSEMIDDESIAKLGYIDIADDTFSNKKQKKDGNIALVYLIAYSMPLDLLVMMGINPNNLNIIFKSL